MIIRRKYFNNNAVNYFFRKNFPEIKEILTVPAFCPIKYFETNETYTDQEVAESIKYYRTDQPVVFENQTESFLRNHVTYSDSIIKILIKNYGMKPKNFFLVNASFPTQMNVLAYKKLCERNNFTEVNLILLNILEQGIKNQFNSIKNAKSRFNLLSIPKHKKKKFVSFNAVPRVHRVCFTMLLIQKKLLNLGYFSFGLNCENIMLGRDKNQIEKYVDDVLKKYNLLSDNICDSIHDVLVKNFQNFPMTLTKKNFINTKYNEYNDIFIEDFKLFNNSYFHLIMETNFFGNENFSEIFNFKESMHVTEKIFRGFVFPIPFVVLNRPYCLSALHEYGYKTFHPYIDESYDKIENDEDRMLAILDEVERLCKLTDQEWLKIQTELKPIFIHNFKKIMASQDFFLLNKI